MLDTRDERIAATNMVCRIYMSLDANGAITLADSINMSFQYIEFAYPPPVPVVTAPQGLRSSLSIDNGIGVK